MRVKTHPGGGRPKGARRRPDGRVRVILVGTLLAAAPPGLMSSTNETAMNVTACVARYARALGDAYASPTLETRIARAMDASFRGAARAKHGDNAKAAIVGIGPGSSGTRSLFLAATLLGVPGAHYSFTAEGCVFGRMGKKTLSTDEFVRSDRYRFWADTPVPSIWATLPVRLPRAKFVLTQLADADAWLRKRLSFRKRYCFHRSSVDCQIPLAVGLRDGALDAWRATSAQVAAAIAAYDDLARCLIPPDRLLHMVFPPPPPPDPTPWQRLVAFLGDDHLGATPEDRTFVRRVLNTTFPHWGETSCEWNGTTCKEALRQCSSELKNMHREQGPVVVGAAGVEDNKARRHLVVR